MTNEMRELVERLRRGPLWGDGSPIGSVVGAVNGATMNEAATAIQSLSERNAVLEGMLWHFVKWADRARDGENGVHYLNGEGPPFGDGADAWDDLDELRTTARAALTPQEEHRS